MRFFARNLALVFWVASGSFLMAGITPEQVQQLPPPATRPINFTADIKPIFEASCIKCHGRGRDKGGLQLDTRETLLKGGDSGPAIVPGKSADSYIIELVQGFDPDNVMPKKGTKLTPEQIGLLRAWIDQGAKWDEGVTFARVAPANLNPRRPEVPAGPKNSNPIDRLLKPYFVEQHIEPPPLINDRIFARRVYLDVIGLLPTPKQMDAFVADRRADKRSRLVRTLLADRPDYAQHWLTFWNDALRNDYRGTGYIDGGRKEITYWLYSALATNMHYNEFVARLVNPTPESEGFSKGIVWRGAVNASQTPQMQAAQNICQVFMGVNLKCASCHDSFINDLTLADAYGLAGVYSKGPLEMVYCDKPTGKKAELKFLYPELGIIDSAADKTNRLKQFAEIITGPKDGRLTRTIVNRLWQKFMGRGLVEPVDEMDKPSWNTDLLDWLAEDLVDNQYDLKKNIEVILTSQAYQLPAVSMDEKSNDNYVFHGPLVRRMSAEQFRDALGELTGVWYDQSVADIDFTAGTKFRPTIPPVSARWIWDAADAEKTAAPGTRYFRTRVRLDELPAVALAFVVADNSFTLYVNGKKLGAGEDYQHFKTINLRPQLVEGENTIAVSAVNGSDAPNPAALFLYAYVRGTGKDKGAIMDFGTDASWLRADSKVSGWEKASFEAKDWRPAVELGGVSMAPWNLESQFQAALATPQNYGRVRAALANADALQVALGRPNREQTVTTRAAAATTLQALELTNGREMADLIRRGAENAITETSDGAKLVPLLYGRTLGRQPTAEELKLACEMIGSPAQPAGVEDFLWALTMLPEFQLIY